jgi:hypothetical protein
VLVQPCPSSLTRSERTLRVKQSLGIDTVSVRSPLLCVGVILNRERRERQRREEEEKEKGTCWIQGCFSGVA